MRHVCNLLSLNIKLRLLTVENQCNKLFSTLYLLLFIVCNFSNVYHGLIPQVWEMNLVMSLLLYSVSSRSGIIVYSNEEMLLFTENTPAYDSQSVCFFCSTVAQQSFPLLYLFSVRSFMSISTPTSSTPLQFIKTILNSSPALAELRVIRRIDKHTLQSTRIQVIQP